MLFSYFIFWNIDDWKICDGKKGRHVMYWYFFYLLKKTMFSIKITPQCKEKPQYGSLLFTYIDHYLKKQTVTNGKIL